MSFSAVALIYGLNTWLPEIMGRSGHGTEYAFAFLLALNGGAITGGRSLHAPPTGSARSG
ncbi:hypothetical protein [Streptomyces mirabilis]|uniref:hypothetical protein n=1 Tax=Streptomyces mirabilis TaxID=68239 RepID=UPI0036634308